MLDIFDFRIKNGIKGQISCRIHEWIREEEKEKRNNRIDNIFSFFFFYIPQYRYSINFLSRSNTFFILSTYIYMLIFVIIIFVNLILKNANNMKIDDNITIVEFTKSTSKKKILPRHMDSKRTYCMRFRIYIIIERSLVPCFDEKKREK